MPIVQVNNVTKVFKERSNSIPVYALASVSIEIEEGAFTAVCGPSGSGKTTLLNLIGCLDRPTEGTITLGGEAISSLPQRKLSALRLNKIGFIFQEYNLIPTLTAIENVEYVLWLQKVSAHERRKRAIEICQRFKIDKLVNRRPFQMSRGQQQRVAVARAIVHKPSIVLGDELTANLDHKTGTELMEFLRELNEKENITFLYATHDPAMMKLAHRIISLQDGKLINEKAAIQTDL
ncbi:MAG: ABC transporter ATP-binding protein [Candidatus Omnitrophica bacterium]|nr:ABC transporter ATP-binding protein [Candidatus Omnitrophota bacterium]